MIVITLPNKTGRIWTHTSQPMYPYMSSTTLLRSVDRDGLAFGVIEPVHGPDVHHHHDTVEGDGEKDEHHEEAGPDGHGEESNAVEGIAEFHLGRVQGLEERLHL